MQFVHGSRADDCSTEPGTREAKRLNRSMKIDNRVGSLEWHREALRYHDAMMGLCLHSNSIIFEENESTTSSDFDCEMMSDMTRIHSLGLQNLDVNS